MTTTSTAQRHGADERAATGTAALIDPLADERWGDLVARHPRASVFHTRGWLEALKRTYGYEPIAVTTTSAGPLENGLALCRVRTPFARRLVSLPFSDHCEPLVDDPARLSAMLAFLVREVDEQRWRSAELRPVASPGLKPRPTNAPENCAANPAGRSVGRTVGRGFSPGDTLANCVGRGFSPGDKYCLHTLDLARPLDAIFAGFHHSNTQRAIRRAEREGLEYETGASERLLTDFYRLLRMTRRRHGRPPQPMAWFRNLAACLPGALAIHVARKDGVPVASILTLSFRRTLVYKYGGSDERHHRLGGMPFLFWRAIEGAKAQGIEEFDLGRSELDQPGLIAFKDHLGAARATLTYYAYPPRRRAGGNNTALARGARLAFRYMPDAALDLVGRVLYRHVG